MKNDLTQKQTNFITYLSDEFNKINQTGSNETFNIININDVNNDLNVISIAKKELKLHNDAMIALHNENIMKTAELMNADFKKADFPIIAEIKISSEGNGIEVVYEDMKSLHSSDIYYYIIKMETSRLTENISHGLHTIGSKIKNIQFVTKWDSKEFFSTPQLFFADPKMQKKLVELVRTSFDIKAKTKTKF